MYVKQILKQSEWGNLIGPPHSKHADNTSNAFTAKVIGFYISSCDINELISTFSCSLLLSIIHVHYLEKSQYMMMAVKSKH